MAISLTKLSNVTIVEVRYRPYPPVLVPAI